MMRANESLLCLKSRRLFLQKPQCGFRSSRMERELLNELWMNFQRLRRPPTDNPFHIRKLLGAAFTCRLDTWSLVFHRHASRICQCEIGAGEEANCQFAEDLS